AAYQQAGVKEYWIVDPLKKIVSLYFFQVDAFLDSGLPIRLKEMTDILHSKELSEFEMTLEEIFNQ
ncbi:MAG: Uma2 family endonuclease, partial [Streptococcaceae bacterium]|nr:Uma2 family endonuclease [Streptococcaceae bacterium]